MLPLSAIHASEVPKYLPPAKTGASESVGHPAPPAKSHDAVSLSEESRERNSDALRDLEVHNPSDPSVVAERMMLKGSIWKSLSATHDELSNGRHRLLDTDRIVGTKVNVLSGANVANLERRLHPLSERERHYVDSAMKAPWYLTHATSKAALDKLTGADGSLHLRSRDELVQKKIISHDHPNTGSEDAALLGGTDHVYTGIEIGVNPKKQQSRLGQQIIRAPFTPAHEQRSISLPDDQFGTIDGAKTLSKRTLMHDGLGLNSIQFSKLKQGDEFSQQDFVEQTFAGSDVKRGLLLQGIADRRKILESTGFEETKPLERTDSNDLNTLINGYGRPQVLFPKELELSSDAHVVHDFSRPNRSGPPPDLLPFDMP